MNFSIYAISHDSGYLREQSFLKFQELNFQWSNVYYTQHLPSNVRDVCKTIQSPRSLTGMSLEDGVPGPKIIAFHPHNNFLAAGAFSALRNVESGTDRATMFLNSLL